MAKQIFDQDRPRSTMARRLDEAFAGCEEWTIAPASRRRGGVVDSIPEPDEPIRIFDGAAMLRTEERRAA